MIFRHIGSKILAVVGTGVVLGLMAVVLFYAKHQEEGILAQNERTMRKLTESVEKSLQTIMLAGYADIAQRFADGLKAVPDVVDFRIMRTNGNEAFRDNRTILSVNKRLGEEEFKLHDSEQVVPVLPDYARELKEVVQTRQLMYYYETSAGGERYLTYLAPVVNLERCHRCHGSSEPLRGVIKLTTSLAKAEADIKTTRLEAMIVVLAAMFAIMTLTWFMIRRSVVKPIMEVTSAMALASEGDLTRQVPILGQDELGSMAKSFNSMIVKLLRTYTGLQHEQDKLTTIILSAREGIVVTDSEGRIVLVNPAAETLLDKPLAQIMHEGMSALFDDPAKMEEWLDRPGGGSPEMIEYKGRILSVHAASIRTAKAKLVGSACLIRDITEEKRLEQKLLNLSRTDALTSLYNRRFLEEALANEYTRSRRFGHPISVLMFDVDHFKRFNDEHGHDQGDRVLQAMGKAMNEVLRKVDILCRYGGEEFVAILPNADAEAAERAAERLREHVAGLDVDGLHVTISIGVATYPDFAPNSAIELVEIADGALYAAKDGGRNCVRRALPGHSAPIKNIKKEKKRAQDRVEDAAAADAAALESGPAHPYDH